MIPTEKKYAFRQRLQVIHPTDIRNPARVVSKDELEITDAFCLCLDQAPGRVAVQAAKDFQDFLLTSMGVSIRVMKKAAPSASPVIQILVDPGMDELRFQVEVEEGIRITAGSERSVAQALYFLEDNMRAIRAPYLKKQTTSKKFMFSPRMIHSGYGLDQYPNEHLSAIAHAGMDAILVFVTDVNGTPCGFLDFNDLIYRAAGYGIDVYAYSFLESKMHPQDEGAQEFYDQAYGTLFENCPGLKGVILVGESVGFPSKDPHVSAAEQFALTDADGIPYTKPKSGFWPCEDYPEWLECIKKAVRQHNPEADIVFWTYNWGCVEEEARINLIKKLPTDITLMATFEMFESFQAEGFIQTCADYSLAFAGPGNYFSSEAKAAAERGIRMYTMANTGGLTWDIGTIPYEPMPYQWMRRYEGLRYAYENYSLRGLMDSHHFGFWPSFIGDLAKYCFMEESTSMGACLDFVLQMRYGEECKDRVNEALKLWSEAIRCYTPSDADQYGAFRAGPAYPLCLIKAIKPPSEKYAEAGNAFVDVMYPADYSPINLLPSGRGMLPALRIDGEIASLTKMRNLMEQGVEILSAIENPGAELEYLINLGKYIAICVQTGIHAKQWFMLTSRLKMETQREKVLELIGQVKQMIRAECANAEKAIPLVEKDSRLGWEPRMDYLADANHIRWKLRYMEYVMDHEVGCYEAGSSDKWFANEKPQP